MMKSQILWILFLPFFLTACEAFIFLSFEINIQIFFLFFEILTAVYGFTVFRKLDWSDLFYLDAELNKGNRVVRELWQTSMLIIGSAFLIFPGIITDVIGSLLLLPPLREWIIDTVFYDKVI